jgi:hypothetical protein
MDAIAPLPMNMYSLWRGTTLLGHFNERAPVMHHGKRVGALGILEPSEAFVGIDSMMQTRVSIFPGRPVFQHPLEPELLGVTRPPRGHSHSSGALLPLSEDEARGVPPEQILQIRDASGASIDTDTLSLQLYAIPDGVDPAPFEAHGFSDTSREVWHVLFASHERAT